MARGLRLRHADLRLVLLRCGDGPALALHYAQHVDTNVGGVTPHSIRNCRLANFTFTRAKASSPRSGANRSRLITVFDDRV